MLEKPKGVQNPRFIGHQGLAGEMDLDVRFDVRDDVVVILLYYADGRLSLLEDIGYNFPAPVPAE